MANVKQQLNDLSVCSECWIPFDEGEHEPKLLNCPTHPLTTICIECLKVCLTILLVMAVYIFLCVIAKNVN